MPNTSTQESFTLLMSKILQINNKQSKTYTTKLLTTDATNSRPPCSRRRQQKSAAPDIVAAQNKQRRTLSTSTSQPSWQSSTCPQAPSNNTRQKLRKKYFTIPGQTIENKGTILTSEKLKKSVGSRSTHMQIKGCNTNKRQNHKTLRDTAELVHQVLQARVCTASWKSACKSIPCAQVRPASNIKEQDQ